MSLNIQPAPKETNLYQCSICKKNYYEQKRAEICEIVCINQQMRARNEVLRARIIKLEGRLEANNSVRGQIAEETIRKIKLEMQELTRELGLA